MPLSKIFSEETAMFELESGGKSSRKRERTVTQAGNVLKKNQRERDPRFEVSFDGALGFAESPLPWT
jgi:hypothetical protein